MLDIFSLKQIRSFPWCWLLFRTSVSRDTMVATLKRAQLFQQSDELWTRLEHYQNCRKRGSFQITVYFWSEKEHPFILKCGGNIFNSHFKSFSRLSIWVTRVTKNLTLLIFHSKWKTRYLCNVFPTLSLTWNVKANIANAPIISSLILGKCIKKWLHYISQATPQPI